MNLERRSRRRRHVAQRRPADESAGDDRADLACSGRDREGEDCRTDRDRGALPVGHKLRAIPLTARTTTATATIYTPSSQLASDRSPNDVTPYPNRIISRAEGVVKTSQA